MMPMIRQGIDNVILTAAPERLKKYDLPLYQRGNGQYVLHRIVEAGECYTCVGDNQFELERGLRHDQMIAVMVAFTRGANVTAHRALYIVSTAGFGITAVRSAISGVAASAGCGGI